MNSILIPMYGYATLCLSMSISGRLGCFHALATVNTAAVNTSVKTSLWVLPLTWEYIPRSRIMGHRVVFLKNFENHHMFSPVHLHSHPQCPPQQLFFDFLIVAILVGMRLISHCSSDLHYHWGLVIFEHLFVCLLAIYISSLERCLSLLPIFEPGSVCVWGGSYFYYCWVLQILYLSWIWIPCNAGHPSSVPGWGRSPGGGDGYPLQYSCLENSMDRGAWQAI